MIKKKRTVQFYAIMADKLDKRLDLVSQGIVPLFTDQRNFFYDCRTTLLNTTNLNEIDTKVKSNKQMAFTGAISDWCKLKCIELGMDVNRWWIIRDKLNINASGKAVCQGEIEKYLVDYTNRDKMASGCSFILICEKTKVGLDLLKALKEKGYKVNLVITGGLTSCDAKESIIQAVEGLEEKAENFYILILHDYDLAGIEIFANLHQYHNRIIDVGMNESFIRFLKNRGTYNPRLVEERCLNKKFMGHTQEFIKTYKYGLGYSFDYLQGVQQKEKEWLGHRIEIDAVEVSYGIEPFVEYIEKCIENKKWDLTRIGINEQHLTEPTNKYEISYEVKKDEVVELYDEKLTELSATYKEIIDTIKTTLTQPTEFSELKHKHLSDDGVVLRDLEPLLDKYSDAIGYDWKAEYQRKLDQQVNDKLKCWDRPVNKAVDDVAKIKTEIETEMKENIENDPKLSEFDEELDDLDCGETELDEIEIPDRKMEINKVIDALIALRDAPKDDVET